jgi:hypothetical protein
VSGLCRLPLASNSLISQACVGVARSRQYGQPMTLPPRDICQRISRLHAMMNSDSSHEAETARQKLRKLLAEHGCSWSDLPDILAAAAAPNFTGDTATSLVDKGVFPRGKPLTPDGKLIWKIADLDSAIERAWRTRKPASSTGGIVRHRLEHRPREQQQESSNDCSLPVRSVPLGENFFGRRR